VGTANTGHFHFRRTRPYKGFHKKGQELGLDTADIVLCMTNTSFQIRSRSSIKPKLADRLSDSDKSKVVNALVARFGSRRALIEELDRRKRLALLKPPSHVNRKGEKGRSPSIQNKPNPQWREISSPNLLIEGELIGDFKNTAYNLSEALLEGSPEKGRRYKHAPLAKRIRPSQATKTGCKTCGGHVDEFTSGCDTCANRHCARRRNALRRAEREGFVK
jgi:hypothetical protein